MLFYKRVEPEEENGKDFSFDVSPDLLEVRHVTLSGVFFFCRHVRVLHSRPPLSLSVDLARQHAVPPGQEYIRTHLLRVGVHAVPQEDPESLSVFEILL